MCVVRSVSLPWNDGIYKHVPCFIGVSHVSKGGKMKAVFETSVTNIALFLWGLWILLWKGVCERIELIVLKMPKKGYCILLCLKELCFLHDNGSLDTEK